MGDVSAVSDDPVVLYHVLLAEFLAQEWSAMLVQFSMAVLYSMSRFSWRVPRPGVVGDADVVLYGPVMFYCDAGAVLYGPVVFSTTLFLASSRPGVAGSAGAIFDGPVVLYSTFLPASPLSRSGIRCWRFAEL
jgi:hypothetical protein